MGKKAVLILYFYQCTGGAHRYLHSVCEYWRQQGYSFEVWYYRAEGDAPVPDYAHRLPHIYPVRFLYANRSVQLATSTLAELIRRKGRREVLPDVLVTLDAGETLLIGMIARFFHILLVQNDRGMNEYFRSVLNVIDYNIYRLAQRLSKPFVTKWVVNSAAKVGELLEAGIDAGKVVSVENGIRFYHTSGDVETGTQSNRSDIISIGFFSRPSPDRGVDILFELIRLYRQRGEQEQVLFFITADEQHIPPDLRDCEQVIPLGTLEHEEVAAWMTSMDIILVPTRHEAFGNTVVEGLYYGAVVAASATGNLLQWQGTEGLVLVEQHDNPQQWLDVVVSMLPSIRHRQRHKRTSLAERYDFRRQAELLFRELTTIMPAL